MVFAKAAQGKNAFAEECMLYAATDSSGGEEADSINHLCEVYVKVTITPANGFERL